MFVGLREIRAAKGRFTLMGAVVAMITLLLVMLTGLTNGLASQNTAALEGIDPDRFVLGTTAGDTPPEDLTFPESSVTGADLQAWRDTPGVTEVQPVGMTQTLLTGDSSSSVAVLGVPTGSGLVERTAGAAESGRTEPADGGVVVSESIAADQDLTIGELVKVGNSDLEVQGIVADQYYSHSEVVWVNSSSWREIAHAEDDVVGTALAVFGTDVAWDDTAAQTSTLALPLADAFAALPAYSSEQGSLVMMQGFLYAISALVIVSFVTVWTIQRTRDLAVLRALGGSPGYLLRDSLGQAAVILAIGVTVGAVLGGVLGALSATAVPFTSSLLLVVGPSAGIWVLGVLGSALAVRRVTRVDPVLALGGN